jgi:hypothetical protein
MATVIIVRRKDILEHPELTSKCRNLVVPRLALFAKSEKPELSSWAAAALTKPVSWPTHCMHAAEYAAVPTAGAGIHYKPGLAASTCKTFCSAAIGVRACSQATVQTLTLHITEMR